MPSQISQKQHDHEIDEMIAKGILRHRAGKTIEVPVFAIYEGQKLRHVAIGTTLPMVVRGQVAVPAVMTVTIPEER